MRAKNSLVWTFLFLNFRAYLFSFTSRKELGWRNALRILFHEGVKINLDKWFLGFPYVKTRPKFFRKEGSPIYIFEENGQGKFRKYPCSHGGAELWLESQEVLLSRQEKSWNGAKIRFRDFDGFTRFEVHWVQKTGFYKMSVCRLSEPIKTIVMLQFRSKFVVELWSTFSGYNFHIFSLTSILRALHLKTESKNTGFLHFI